MSSTALARVADTLPASWWDRRRLKRVLRRARTRKARLTFDMLLRRAHPIEPELLSMLLSLLVKRGLVRRKFLVEEDGRGLKKFDSIEEIFDSSEKRPPTVWDDVTEKEVEVSLDNLRVLYEFG
jgi:hypothetical protein